MTSKSTTPKKDTINKGVKQEELAINGVQQVVVPQVTKQEEIIFQVTDWSTTSEDNEIGDDVTTKYVIRMFGLTKEGHKVFVKVNNFNPYFYIKIPENWRKTQVDTLMSLAKADVLGQDSRSDKTGVANSLKHYETVEKCIFKEFTNYKTFKFVKLIFHSYEGYRAYQRAFNKKISNTLLGGKATKYEAFETNIDPMFRFMHIQNIKSMGMIKIGRYTKLIGTKNISTDEIAISTNYTNVLPVEDTTILPLVVASFDLECYSEDGSFPIPERPGDQIIQIGTTFNRYGEDECYLKHIITLGTCNPIPGVEVVACATETEVLMEWTKLIRKINPEVITGYNIFGFDYPYLEARAKLLGCYSAFSKLGRIKNVQSPYIEKDLSSAALGKNILHYFTMEGRVNIDVMKVVQRDHKLGSYKLDNVAADFIRDEIAYVQFGDDELISKENCNEERDDYEGTTTKIFTKGIYGLDIGRVVKICFNDGLSDNSYRNDEKFRVLDIKTKALKIGKGVYDMILIDGVLDQEALMLDKFTVYWSQSKDDMPIAQLFKMQKQGPKERAVIANYCVQDCVLVNKLINKLQIITNNVGMANVSSVPLSYIFLRGQGVKALSLVSKKCQERNHVMPVLKQPYVDKEKKKAEDALKTKAQLKAELEEEILKFGYEGAVVFEPKRGVYLDDPVTVLDYNSLYPNSMRWGNFSHECKVLNDAYRNLPDYYYNDVTYNNSDGTTKTCTFAKPKDPKKPRGIIVEILTDLLDARANTRILQKKFDKDSFEFDVLEGLQLAYKCTANSIYGQNGAKTSAIYNKDIAACTTATGKAMLHAAKIFAELIFNKLAALIHDDNKIEYEKHMELLFNKQIDEFIGEENVEGLKNDPEGERYQYLNVFKNNTMSIDDKLIDVKSGITCRNDYVKWFYEKVKQLLGTYTINILVCYGDTDSTFKTFSIKENGVLIDGKKSLKISMDLGKLLGGLLFKILPEFQNMAYEKTFYPFILVSKKRYVGNKYEFNDTDYYQASMGIVLKRRDNCDLTKIVVGLIVRSILEEKSIEKAIAFTKETLRNILIGKYPINKFVVTKTLKGPSMTVMERKIEQNKAKEDRYYSDRTSLAHVVLADRIAERSPGNAPASNERIPFAYVIVPFVVKKQGERVEHPDYIIENNLELDYVYYILHQFMKPSIQFLELLTPNPEKIFEHVIMIETNRRTGKRPLNYYFKLLEEIEQAKNMPDAFRGEDEDSDEEDEEEEGNKEFNKQFITNFDNDDNINYDKKEVVHRASKKPVGKTPIVKKVVAKKPVVKKVKTINVTNKKINNNGGFSL